MFKKSSVAKEIRGFVYFGLIPALLFILLILSFSIRSNRINSNIDTDPLGIGPKSLNKYDSESISPELRFKKTAHEYYRAFTNAFPLYASKNDHSPEVIFATILDRFPCYKRFLSVGLVDYASSQLQLMPVDAIPSKNPSTLDLRLGNQDSFIASKRVSLPDVRIKEIALFSLIIYLLSILIRVLVWAFKTR